MISKNTIEYILMNPTQNYTILVLTDVPTNQYEKIAKDLLAEEVKAEQVGFLSFELGKGVFLRMAGDEFCGNATMSAAVYYCIRNNITRKTVAVKAYSLDNLINVQVEKKENDEWEGVVEMPKDRGIKEITFKDGATLPVVFMDGIAHIIVEKYDESDTIFEKSLKLDIFKKYCEFLNVQALGVMKYYPKNSKLFPLVYVRGVNTMYFENSCASGTAALGYYLNSKSDVPINLSIEQACGKCLEVYTNDKKKLYLKGRVKLEYSRKISL